MSLDEILIKSPKQPLYWGPIHNNENFIIQLRKISWPTVTHYVYSSILQNPNVIAHIELNNLYSTVERLYVGEIIQSAVNTIRHAFQLLNDQSLLFRDQLIKSGDHPLYTSEIIGIESIDKVLKSERIIGNLLEQLRPQSSNPDADYFYIEADIGISLDRPYSFSLGERKFSTIRQFLMFFLCIGRDPNFNGEGTVENFEKAQAFFFDTTTFNALNKILPIKMENTLNKLLLEQIPINFRTLNQGFLSNYIDNHTNNILRGMKSNHRLFRTPEIALFENKSSIFYKWSISFQLPALLDNLEVLEKFLKSLKKNPLSLNQILLFLSSMLSNCDWKVQNELPPSFQQEIKEPEEVCKILWGYTSGNLQRLQNQPIVNIYEFMRVVNYQIKNIYITFKQVLEVILKGILLFMHLEDTQVYQAHHLKFALLLCNIKVKTTLFYPRTDLESIEIIEEKLGIIDTESRNEILNTVFTLSEIQYELTERERSRLIVFG